MAGDLFLAGRSWLGPAPPPPAWPSCPSSPAGRLIEAAAATEPSTARGLKEIEHVVILMQENRSFDHYFGTLSGVAGFSDSYCPASRGSTASNTQSSTSSATHPAPA